jgi:predicted deacylase
MLVRNGHCTLSDIEALFPGQPEPLVPKKAVDILQSHLINGFETALDQGMRPGDALAVVLCWVSSEMVRIGSDKIGGP